MKARRTRWQVYLAFFIGFTIIGTAYSYVILQSSIALLGVPWLVSVLILLLGIIVLYLAWQVHLYVSGELKKMTSERSANTLILCKALAVAGFSLAGFYLGQVIMSIPHYSAEYFHNIIVQCLVAVVICVIDAIIGIIGEYWCQIPPAEGTDKPSS